MEMKNILLIGKLNDMVKDLNRYLSRGFHVQLSSDSGNVVNGMLKVVEPDLVVISLVGMYDVHDGLFQIFQNQYPGVPVLTIGTQEEWQRFTRYYEGSQFQNLVRPMDNAQVYEAVCERLGVNPETGEAQGEGHNGKKRILVVDDNGPTLRNIKSMLEDIYDVTIVNSGMNAMKSIGKRKPDLILLDYEMPVCDGRQTLEMIRADDEIADIPVVFLTGVNDREHIAPILALSPAGYLLKPPVKERLLKTLAEALGESES